MQPSHLAVAYQVKCLRINRRTDIHINLIFLGLILNALIVRTKGLCQKRIIALSPGLMKQPKQQFRLSSEE